MNTCQNIWCAALAPKLLNQYLIDVIYRFVIKTQITKLFLNVITYIRFYTSRNVRKEPETSGLAFKINHKTHASYLLLLSLKLN